MEEIEAIYHRNLPWNQHRVFTDGVYSRNEMTLIALWESITKYANCYLNVAQTFWLAMWNSGVLIF